MPSFAGRRPAPCCAAFAAVIALTVAVAPFTALCAESVPEEIRHRSDDLDVPYVPSHDNVLKTMFDMARPAKGDFLVDLGSGDGRIVIAAARQFGLRGFGVDLNEGLVAIANEHARRAGVASRAKFYVRDLFKTDIRQASIVTMYLLPEVVQSLRDKLLTELRPGTRIVSHDYHLADWRPDDARVVDIGVKSDESIVYFWVVPVRVAGVWEWSIRYPRYFQDPVEYSAALTQRFQDLDGKVTVFPADERIYNARISGRRVSFSVAGELDEKIVQHDFSGTVEGDRITGTVRLYGGVRPAILPWSARRTRRAE